MVRVRLLITVALVAGAGAVFAARGPDARAAAIPTGGSATTGGSGPVAMAPGTQLAVVVPTFHNGSHANVTSVSVGTKVHVRVTVAGAFGTPVGYVNGSLYPNGTCSGQALDYGTPTELVNGSIDLTTLTAAPTIAGKLSVIITYPGESPYAGTTSACTSIDVTKATASIGLTVHDADDMAVTKVLTVSSVHPFVTVQSRVGWPTGTIDVSWWTNATCAGAAAEHSVNFQLIDGKRDTTFFQVAPTGGWYSFRAHYDGDAGFKAGNGQCVKYEVVRRTPTFSSTVHDADHQHVTVLPVGEEVHPFATLAGGAGPDPSGEVRVRIYADGGCSSPDIESSAPVAQEMELHDFASTRTYPGLRSYRLSYEGDAVFKSVLDDCIKVTWKGVPTASGGIHDGSHAAVSTVDVGEVLHFRVAVDGAFGAPTGSVDVALFDNGTCSGQPVAVGPFGLDGSGTSDDLDHPVTFDAPGKASYRVNYQGDGKYFGDSTGCKVVTVVEVAAAPTPKPTPKPTAKPAAAPTAAPTAAPGPTPVAAGSAEPVSSSGPAASHDPGPSTGSEASETPAVSGDPGVTAPTSSAGPGAGSTEAPVGVAAASAAPAGVSPGTAGAAGGEFPWWLFVLLALCVGAGGAFVGWRLRGTPARA